MGSGALVVVTGWVRPGGADATHIPVSGVPAGVYLPPLDRYDAAALSTCLVLFGIAFFVYPVEPFQIVFVLIAFVVSLTRMASILQKWMFAGE